MCNLSNGFKKKKVPDGLAVFMVILVIIGFYVGFVELISSSLSLFIEDAPKYQQRLNEIRDAAQESLKSRGIDAIIIEIPMLWIRRS